MNPGQLSALFAQHKVAILGAGAAGAVLLGLRTRKKGATAKTPAAQPAGTIPAAAVVPANGLQSPAGMSSSDAYALQDELAKLVQQQAPVTGQSGVTDLPPVASTLYAPTGSGNYGLYNNGTVAEIESDGSQLGLSWPQWQALQQQGAKVTTTIPGSSVGQYYEVASNLAAKQKPAA